MSWKLQSRETREGWPLMTVETRETRERWPLLTVETRETREGWPLLTVEAKTNKWVLKEYKWKGSFLWFFGLIMSAQETFIIPLLIWSAQYKIFFSSPYTFFNLCVPIAQQPGSESGQKQSVKLLQNMVYSTIQHPHPSPQTHAVCIYCKFSLGREGGGGQRECRGATVHKYNSFIHGGNSSQAGSKTPSMSECISIL